MKKIFLVGIVSLIIFLAWFFHALQPMQPESAAIISVVIKPGSSLSQIAQTLKRERLIRSPWVFSVAARFSGNALQLQAGTFGLNRAQSVSKIIDILASGKSQEFLVTIPEGYTVAQIDALLASKGLGKSGDIIQCAFTCDFSTFEFLPKSFPGTLKDGIGSRLEGYLFPETYAVVPGEYVPKFFLERMLGTFRSRIVKGHEEALKTSSHTLHEIVTMASLIEAETRKDAERQLVSGILWKRLSNRVVLGVDATTRYVLQKPTQPLTKSDVEVDSKYNTRRTQGLPPSPIENPGEASFIAALNPKESEYWYYLHGNDGVIRFAVTNDEHNRNKAKYIR